MGERADSQVQQSREDFRGRKQDAAGEYAPDMFEELAALESASAAQIGVMLRGMARIGQVSILFGARIAAEWQRMALEATKRATDTFGAPFF